MRAAPHGSTYQAVNPQGACSSEQGFWSLSGYSFGSLPRPLHSCAHFDQHRLQFVEGACSVGIWLWACPRRQRQLHGKVEEVNRLTVLVTTSAWSRTASLAGPEPGAVARPGALFAPCDDALDRGLSEMGLGVPKVGLGLPLAPSKSPRVIPIAGTRLFPARR
jgi:hypothetical protein